RRGGGRWRDGRRGQDGRGRTVGGRPGGSASRGGGPTGPGVGGRAGRAACPEQASPLDRIEGRPGRGGPGRGRRRTARPSGGWHLGRPASRGRGSPGAPSARTRDHLHARGERAPGEARGRLVRRIGG